MKKRILILITFVIGGVFFSCNREVILTYIDNIVIDLGSTEEDVLAYVSASDGSAVSVSGIDYDLVGEQMATFTADDKSEKKSVKIKSDKLAGMYRMSVFLLNEGEEYNLTPGNGWLMEITKGSQYNQINIPDTSETGVSVFVDQGKLVITFNGKDSAIIPGYTGEFAFALSRSHWTFSNIVYVPIGKGDYALKGFLMKQIPIGTNYEHYYRVELDKQTD